jgi:hypothetical protein
LIALSECLRVYGSIPTQSINNVIALLQEKITALENSVNELKGENREIKSESLKREEQAIEREKRLMALLEHQAGIAENKQGGFFSGLFKR